jgi:hypothetical protein
MPDIGDLGAVRNGDKALKVAIYATLTYDIISATNSSPQTSEINARKRAPTLMKWVYIGLAQAAGFGLLGAFLDDDTWPPLLGVSLASVVLWIQYNHAIKAGLNNPGPGTETYT